MGNNSHPSDHAGSARNNKAPDMQDDREGSSGGAAKEEKSHNKEKSVLQAKLTKLAIQIGYAGILYNAFKYVYSLHCILEGCLNV